MVSSKFDLYDRMIANATVIGIGSIPKKKHRVGLTHTLTELSKRLQPGLVLRIIVPNCLASNSLRRAWVRVCGHNSHAIVEENDEATYIAYLWKD